MLITIFLFFSFIIISLYLYHLDSIPRWAKVFRRWAKVQQRRRRFLIGSCAPSALLVLPNPLPSIPPNPFFTNPFYSQICDSWFGWRILGKNKNYRFCVLAFSLKSKIQHFLNFFTESFIQISIGHTCGVTGVLKPESTKFSLQLVCHFEFWKRKRWILTVTQKCHAISFSASYILHNSFFKTFLQIFFRKTRIQLSHIMCLLVKSLIMHINLIISCWLISFK